MSGDPAAGGRALFLALTPYNVILSCGIARALGLDAELIVLESVPLSLREAVSSWRENPFRGFETLPGPAGDRSLAFQVWRSNRNAAQARQLVAGRSYDRLFVFHDGRAETQAVMHALEHENTRVILVEEGLSLYVNAVFPHDPRPHKRLLRKLLYGRWWRDLDALGTSPWVEEVWASFPARVRPELEGREIVPLKGTWFHELKDLSLVYQRRLGVDLPPADRGYALVIPDHSSAFAEKAGVREVFREACLAAQRAGWTTLVKYHPLEPEEDPCNFGDLGLALLPRDLGVEFLYVSGLPVSLVVGNASSGLSTARWLLEDCRSISAARVLGGAAAGLEEFFEHIDVELPPTRAELLSRIAALSGKAR